MIVAIGLLVLAAVLVVVGLLGLALPILPGAPLLFAGLVLAGWAEGWAHVGLGTMIALGCMALATYAIDFVAGALGASRVGASRLAIVGAVLGGLVGLFLGIVGVLVGPFVGAVLGELAAQRDLGRAGRVGLGVSIGMALGAAAKLALGFAMIGLFLLARFV
jgi:hypothetical protein